MLKLFKKTNNITGLSHVPLAADAPIEYLWSTWNTVPIMVDLPLW